MLRIIRKQDASAERTPFKIVAYKDPIPNGYMTVEVLPDFDQSYAKKVMAEYNDQFRAYVPAPVKYAYA